MSGLKVQKSQASYNIASLRVKGKDPRMRSTNGDAQVTNTLVRPISLLSTNPGLIRRMITVNTKVDSCKENLAKLNVDYKWIPGENDVRPTPEEIQRKHYHMAYIRQTFATEADFVLKMTLGLPSKRVKGLHVVNRTDLPRKKVFQENMFPYQTQGKHYIMWYTYTPPDEEITKDIDEAIQEIVGHANYKFVWYVNPKMTIPEVFHVQVFWTTE